MAKRWIIAGITIVGGLALTGTDWWRSVFAAQPAMSPGPRVIVSERHDRSPALRTLPLVAPPTAPIRQIPRHSRPTPLVNAGAIVAAADPLTQTFMGSVSMPAASRSFDGVGNVSGVLPSDANGDVGPDHFFQTVNLSLAIYSKGTATTPPSLLYGPFAGNTIWSGFGGPCETHNNGDPIVMYDHLADRWFMSQLALPNVFFGFAFGPFYQCIAVSTTPDPTGAYYRYQFAFDKLNDYPKFGTWPDAYYMAINQFESGTLAWAGQGVIAIDRTRMLSGQPASMVYFDLSATEMTLGGMLPADLDGPPPPLGSPGYFVQMDDDAWGYSSDQLQLWRFVVDWTNPAASTFTGPTLLTTAPFDSDLCGYTPCVRQRGTSARLEAISDRLMYRLQYRNFGSHDALVVNHTVDANGQDHAGIRWYEVRNPAGTPVIYQQGTYAPDANDRTVGSAAMDRMGNLALGFTVSGSGTYPSLRYAGRLATDPPGLLTQGEAELVAGQGSQTRASGRWGDYSALVLDPGDGCTFWYTSQYYAVTSDAEWRTRIGAFKFPSCASPSGLPTVSVTASAPAASEAGLAPGNFTITRTGDTTAALTVSYTVDGTAAGDADYVALPGSVTIPPGAHEATLPVTPLDDLLVEGNESVVVTLEASELYTVGAPAGALVSIASDDAPSDLVIAVLSPPAVGGAGAALTISDTTRNQGAGSAEPSATGFYLSTDTTLGAGDVLLAVRAVPSLEAGATHATSTVVTIPPQTAPGTYYMLGKADLESVVVEADEANNTRSALVRIGPDLVVSATTAPATAAAGVPFSVTETTTNTGGGSAAGSVTSYYLSANVSLDAADPLVGSRAVAALAAGASETGSASVMLPANTPAGAYYIIAKADANGTIAETSEANNARASAQLRAGADLMIAALKVPQAAGAGGSIVISETTKNLGADTAATSQTAFYLSANASLDAADALIGARMVPVLAPGAAESATTTVTVPAGTATGTYYVVAKADATAVVAEGNESNNHSIGALVRIGPDLTAAAISVPATAAAGASITVSDTTSNAGGGSSPPSQTRFYLSVNSSLDSSDVLLGTRAIPALSGGTSHTGSSVVQVAAGTAGGSYYVIAKSDDPDNVAETVETNNTRPSAVLRIGPDLMVSLTNPAAAGAGEPLLISDTTRNQGAGSAEASSTGFYLSTNASLDASDALIGARAVPVLGPNGTHTSSTTVQIPAATATGTYYLVAKADVGSAVGETNENNNTAAAVLRVGPDLVVSVLSGPSSAESGMAVTVTDTTRNQGAGASPPSTTRFYLSTNSALDGSDTLVGTRAAGALGGGASDSASTVLTIPAGLPTATLYLIAVADGATQIPETVETNNTRALLLRVNAAP